MSRPQLTVRRVTPDLEGDFTVLWGAAMLEAGTASAIRAITESRLSVALARDDVCAYLALNEGKPVGYVVLTTGPPSFMNETPCVSIDQIFVIPDARRGGAARALLNAAATCADRLGADQIASVVPSKGREANRFFARLGFSADVIRRVTTPAALRRKLVTGDEPHPALEQLLRRRRSLRARAGSSTDFIHR